MAILCPCLKKSRRILLLSLHISMKGLQYNIFDNFDYTDQ